MKCGLLTVPAMSHRRIVAALVTATLIVSTTADGQQPVVPAVAQPPQPQQQSAAQQVQLIYSPWTKYCAKGQDANARQSCFTGKDGRTESGQVVIAAIIVEPDGEPKKILRVTVPLRVQLAYGTRVIIDDSPPLQTPYVICFGNGCVADYEATPDMIANLKKGQDLYVQAIDENGAPLTLPLPLQEANGSFAKSFDGPPTDPKVFEESYKKLQDELQARASPTAAVTPNPTEK